MKKPSSPGRSRRISKAGKTKSSKAAAAKKVATRKTAPKKAVRKKPAKPAGKAAVTVSVAALRVRLAAAMRIEALDRPKAAGISSRTARPLALAAAPAPQRNDDFPNTFIQTISVRLEDPDHPLRLTWAGPKASGQATGPFRSSPGAGLSGLNCNDVATSRRNGSNCTPKGTFTVTGFAPHLNSHAEATDVTWFVPERGIAFHFYPSVPTFAASHGCVRLESRKIAQLIQNNSRAGITGVVVDGVWTKPAHQY